MRVMLWAGTRLTKPAIDEPADTRQTDQLPMRTATKAFHARSRY